MKKIALINPRYHQSINDGGEILVRRLANHLKNFAEVTILTTKAVDKESWNDEIYEEVESSSRIRILRFSAPADRSQTEFNDLIHLLHSSRDPDTKKLEYWMQLTGPYSAVLFNYLKKNYDNYQLFIFVGYNNAFTYFGLPLVKNKAVLIPLVHNEAMLRFKIFDKLFALPTLILPNSQGEMNILKKRFEFLPPLFTIGIESKKPPAILQKRPLLIKKPYCLYLGRISRFKGTWELIDQFTSFKSEQRTDLKLVLIGKNIDHVAIPKQDYLIHLEQVGESQKYSLLAEAEFLINPSYYESLSLILMEAWQVKKPVLVNACCEVSKTQVIQANGGLFYENYHELAAMMLRLSNPRFIQERKSLGQNGYSWLNRNYSREIIAKKLQTVVQVLAN